MRDICSCLETEVQRSLQWVRGTHLVPPGQICCPPTATPGRAAGSFPSFRLWLAFSSRKVTGSIQEADTSSSCCATSQDNMADTRIALAVKTC